MRVKDRIAAIVAAVVIGLSLGSLLPGGAMANYVSQGLSFLSVTTALGYTPLNKGGDTMTGPLTLGGNALVLNGSSIVGDSANAVAQRNGVNGQAFYIYKSYTDAANWQRIEINPSASSNRIITNWAGTGTAIPLTFGAGAEQWQIGTSGQFIAFADNVYDIGANGANRPRNAFIAGYLVTGTYTVAALPAAATAGAGARALVTDATACTLNGALTGGGAVKCPVHSDGASWLGG